MIDINNIVNTAIAQEINKAITNYVDEYMANVQQEHRRQIDALKVEIEQLKAQREDGTTPNFTGHEVTALQLCVTHETSPVYNAICRIARDVAVVTAEEVMEEHKEEYSHDEYDRIVNFVDDDLPSDFPDFDEFVTKDDLPEFPDVDTLVTKDDLFDAVREAVRDTVENCVSVSLHLS